MSRTANQLVLATLLGYAVAAGAQVDTGKPKDATAVCKDGTFYTGNDQATACKANGGVQEWWGKVVAPKNVPAAKDVPAADASKSRSDLSTPVPAK